MPVTTYEMPSSRQMDGASSERMMIVKGTEDETEALAALVAGVPAIVGSLSIDLASTGVVPIEGTDWWVGTARYGRPEEQRKETGSATFAFDTAGGTQHITQSLATTSQASSGTASDYKGAIGVTADSVEGVDIETSGFDFRVTVYVAAASMTTAYIGALKRLTKRVNQAQWAIEIDGVSLTFAKGCVRLLGVTGAKRISEGDWELSFAFSYREPVSATVNGMSYEAEGWQYVWFRYEESADGTSKRLVRTAVEVLVEQVYEYGDFAELSLPG